MKLSLLVAVFFVGCAAADPTDETDEDLSKTFTYSCRLSHHSADAFKIRVSKTRTKITAADPNELASDLAEGSTLVLDPNYAPHSQAFVGRSRYGWDQSNTVLIMEQSLRTGGAVGFLTIEGGHISRTRA